MARSGQFTVTESLAWSEPSLDVETRAVLFTVPHVAGVVGEVMCTCLAAPEPRLPKLHERTPFAIEQPELLLAASIVQLSPALVGSVSVTVTPLAVPAPLLVAVMTKPIC